MVFETAIRGKSPLTIEAIAVDRRSMAARFIRRVLRGVIGGFARVWSKEFEDDYAGVATKTAGSSLAVLVGSNNSVTALGRERGDRQRGFCDGQVGNGDAPGQTIEASRDVGRPTSTSQRLDHGKNVIEIEVALLVSKDVEYRHGNKVVQEERTQRFRRTENREQVGWAIGRSVSVAGPVVAVGWRAGSCRRFGTHRVRLVFDRWRRARPPQPNNGLFTEERSGPLAGGSTGSSRIGQTGFFGHAQGHWEDEALDDAGEAEEERIFEASSGAS